ncbi:alpha 1,2 mannosyltransferase [Linnemannia gamsii]|uniref:Mannosyltransferase n=1 Tax=Linnemannia gamsii TaxID=64522 RepID=A0A9P6R3F6_9FUNG|nr:alpha 1,2 mannosyltransferase [Linnemannia gamsii]
MQQHRPFSRATWNIYLAFLAVRLFIAFSPGYVHPDEFFQSAEITAGNVFGFNVDIPWEYQPELPCRSIIIPAITTGIPYLFLKKWIGTNSDHFVTTRALFLTQRLAFVLVSLVIDWSIVKMARQIRRSPSIALLLVASSYVTLAYHTHPFSNTVETLVLALSAVVLGKIIQEHDASTTLLTASTSKATTAFHPSATSVHGSLTLTMWNNLQYNLDKDNLALHGLHPRFFHLLLNFPVLFGNLAWVGVTTLISKVMAREWSSPSKLVTALTYSGICGISVLSSMPHQEARFLTPLILPLVISLSGRIARLGRRFWPLWLVLNGVLAIVFGVIHQAGLVPAMGLIQSQSLGFQDCQGVGSSMDHILCTNDPSKPGKF